MELARAKTELDNARENREPRIPPYFRSHAQHYHANYMLAEDELRKANDEFAGLKAGLSTTGTRRGLSKLSRRSKT